MLGIIDPIELPHFLNFKIMNFNVLLNTGNSQVNSQVNPQVNNENNFEKYFAIFEYLLRLMFLAMVTANLPSPCDNTGFLVFYDDTFFN